MTPRLNPYKAAPEAMKAMVALENYVQESGLDHSLIDLVKLAPRRSMAAPIASICIRAKRALAARPRSASICSTRGMNRRFTASASAPPLPGPRR